LRLLVVEWCLTKKNKWIWQHCVCKFLLHYDASTAISVIENSIQTNWSNLT
jgi:hypothetical protein